MKKMILLLVCLGCSLVTNAFIRADVDGIRYEIYDDGAYVSRKSYSGGDYSGEMVIPSSITYKGVIYPVTRINSFAFWNCKKLTSISIPNSITFIGESAFNNCSSLTSIEVPTSVTSIGQNAFKDTQWLKDKPEGCIYINSILYLFKTEDYSQSVSVDIKDGTTEICGNAFSGCTGLYHISIPNTVTSIGEYAFRYCSSLNYVVIPNSVTSISDYVFADSGISSVTLPNSLTEIPSCAFYNCKVLNNVIIPKSVERIGREAFANCTRLSNITIPESLSYIYAAAFNGCTSLSSIVLPNSNYLWIDKETFANCTGLLSVSIPESVCSIYEKAFAGCKNLKTVTIPKGVYEIEEGAFSGCSNLSVELPDSITRLGNNSFDTNAKVYAKRGSITLINLWITKQKCYDIDSTTCVLLPPTLKVQTTASSFKVWIDNYYKEYEYKYNSSYGLEDTVNNIIQIDSTGIDPDTYIDYKISISAFKDKYYYSFKSPTISTEKLVLTTSQPKVISEGNVIVQANTNIDDAETNVGFEWRRTDWTDDFESKSGHGYLYEGTMEGYIRSLNSKYMWKYRPYYESNSGTRYYGEWKGIDPSDFSYFEPTVHTYANAVVGGDNNQSGTTVTLKGYVQRGTDNIQVQGFVYWPTNGPSLAKGMITRAASVPNYAKRAEGHGTVMEVTITDLEPNTDYSYTTFVTTSENETFYGEEQSFKTKDGSATGIGKERMDKTMQKSATAIFDLFGRKHDMPQKGINIIRYEDGTVRKIVVK